MLELLADPNVWIAFATLTVMEIVLGIDNIVFISVLVSRLPREQAEFARKLGIGMVFQHFSLFEAMTVNENIALGMDQPVVRRIVKLLPQRQRPRQPPLVRLVEVADDGACAVGAFGEDVDGDRARDLTQRGIGARA